MDRDFICTALASMLIGVVIGGALIGVVAVRSLCDDGMTAVPASAPVASMRAA